MRRRVLITAPYMRIAVDRFRSVFEEAGVELVTPPLRERFEEADLLELVSDIDGVICGDDCFTERVLEAAPRLVVVSKWGTGIDSIDRDACEKRGIVVSNTPGAFTDPVADSVLGYVLTFARRQPWMDRAMRRGAWEKQPGMSLGECTLGIIGVGAIGRAVAQRAAAFGMRILGNDPVDVPESVLEATGTLMVTLNELLPESDFVSLNCDLNITSLRLMDDTAFDRMKPTAVMINTARGPVVDEAALVRALQSGRIGGAALDVFETEPVPETSPLLAMENVMLAPHNANSSPQAWERVHRNTIRNLLEAFQKRR